MPVTCEDEARRQRRDIGEVHRRLQRGLVLAAVLLLPLVFARAPLNPFGVTKAVLGSALAGAAVAVAVAGAGATRRLTVGRVPLVAAIALFALAALSATVPEASALRAVAGDYTRQAGLLAYACAAALMACAAAALRPAVSDSRLVGDHPVAGLLRTLMVASLPIAGYGGLQALRMDPLDWVLEVGAPPVFSTLGNPNFLAGWLAIAGTATVWGALTRTWSAAWRAGCALLAGLAFAVTLATTSAQGPAAWGVGLAVLVAVRCTGEDRPRPTRARLVAVVLGLSLGLGLGVGVAVGTGLADDVARSVEASYRDRTTLWATAASMGRANAASGVGVDAFGDRYHRHRPLERALRYDAVRPAGTQAHNVALQLFAGGGVPLLAGWLAWAGVIAGTAISGLRRLTGERRLLLGGVLAAWCAYLTQAMVSIDNPPLLATGWILAGGILAASPSGRTRTWRLPGVARSASSALAVAILVVALAPPIRFLQADLAAGAAARSARPEVVESQGNRALQLAGWEPAYPLFLGRHVLALGEERWAIALFDEAIRRNPDFAAAHLDRARVARRNDLLEEAAASYAELVRLVPTTPAVLEEAAETLEAVGQDERADELRRRASVLRDAVR